MKTKILSVLLACLIIALMSFGLYTAFRPKGSEYTRNVDSDCFTMGFYPLNGSETESFELKEGDAIEVSLVRIAGRVDISIGQQGQAPVYRGNDMMTSSFQVNILQDGVYSITLSGNSAEGSVSFVMLRAEREE